MKRKKYKETQQTIKYSKHSTQITHVIHNENIEAIQMAVEVQKIVIVRTLETNRQPPAGRLKKNTR